ncbi:MAG: hypothetical protein OEZ58_05400 [Gammaproteobacteria bacterium]|nr:hypothetical protein [Gammaproteobacteria bacterium]MDH5728401.1 hypothetical protein [Gammaproteobacteria bacterium]
MKYCVVACLLLGLSLPIFADTQVRLKSDYNLKQTVIRYIQALKQDGVPVLAQKVMKNAQGQKIVFTNPLFGTTLGRCNKSVRKDQPLIATVERDANGFIWLSYDEPEAQINDFGVIQCGHETDNMRRALQKYADRATSH